MLASRALLPAMRAVTPYAPRITRAYFNRVRGAATVAQAYRRGRQARMAFKAAKGAASVIQRAWRNRQKRRPGYADRADSHTIAEFNPTPFSMQPLQCKTLVFGYFNTPATGTGGANRLTDQILVKGINFCLNIHTIATFPVLVHFAVLQLPSDTLTNAEIQDGFFRSDNLGTTSQESFVDFTTSASWDIRQDCYKINPDNKKVLTHYKMLLDQRYAAGTTTNVGQGTTKNLKKVERYLKVNRVAKFANDAATTPEKPWIWCIWCMPARPENQPAAGANINMLNFSVREKLYFKNIT